MGSTYLEQILLQFSLQTAAVFLPSCKSCCYSGLHTQEVLALRRLRESAGRLLRSTKSLDDLIATRLIREGEIKHSELFQFETLSINLGKLSQYSGMADFKG